MYSYYLLAFLTFVVSREIPGNWKWPLFRLLFLPLWNHNFSWLISMLEIWCPGMSLFWMTEKKFSAEQENFMKEAFAQAALAVRVGEVPVGCVFVRNGTIVARGHNKTNVTKNATTHAEIDGINSLFPSSPHICAFPTHFTPSDILKDTVLYVTIEPCIMCAWVLRILSIKEVYYGASNPRFGGNGSVMCLHDKIASEKDKNSPQHSILDQTYPSYGGLLEEESINILKNFYEQENPPIHPFLAPVDKRKVRK